MPPEPGRERATRPSTCQNASERAGPTGPYPSLPNFFFLPHPRSHPRPHARAPSCRLDPRRRAWTNSAPSAAATAHPYVVGPNLGIFSYRDACDAYGGARLSPPWTPEKWGHAAADGLGGEGVAGRETGVCRYDATTGVGLSYLWRRRLLQLVAVFATTYKGVGICYLWRRLLPTLASTT
jgi:hypothetical protein